MSNINRISKTMFAMVVAMAVLCVPELTDFTEQSVVTVSFIKPLGTAGSGFQSESQLANSLQPILPSKQNAAVAVETDENKNSDNQPDNVSVWGTIQTEFGTVSDHDRIVFYSLSLNKGYTAFSDFNGYFYIDAMTPANDYRMRVIPVGMFKQYVKEDVDLTSDQTAFSVVLLKLPVGTLSGEVVNSDGTAIPGFGIKIRSPEKSVWAASIITDSAGRFEVENVPIGVLEFSSTFGQPLLITGHDFKDELHTPLTLVVDHGPNQLSGLVYDQFNDPVPGAKVILNWENTERGTRSVVNRRTTTNSSGQFSIKGIGSGKHDLMLTAATGAAYRQTVDFGNDNTELSIVLSQTPLTR